MRKAAAAVSVGTYSVWESTATLRLHGGVQVAWAPMGEERGGGILCRHAHSLFNSNISGLGGSMNSIECLSSL